MTARSKSDSIGAPLASHGQRRIWTADQSKKTSNQQVVPMVYDIAGPVDKEKLEKAINRTIANHEALHTGLIFQSGELIRKKNKTSVRLKTLDVSGLPFSFGQKVIAKNCKAFLERQFDLSIDPMLRAMLILEAPNAQKLLIVAHHSAIDGASIDLIQKHIGQCYRGGSDSEIFKHTEPFGRYVAEISAVEHTGKFEQPLKNILQEFPLEVATNPESNLADFEVNRSPRFQRQTILRSLHNRIVRQTEKIAGLGSSMIYLVAFAIFLSTWFERRDLVIGFPVANRYSANDEAIVGFMVNIVPIKMRINYEESLDDLLARVPSTLFKLRNRLNLPYGLYLQRVTGDPFRFDFSPFDILLTYQPEKKYPLALEGCNVVASDPVDWPVPYGLMLDIEEIDGAASLLVRWDAAKYSSPVIATFCAEFPWLLTQFFENGNMTVGQIQEQLSHHIRASEETLLDDAVQIRKRYLSDFLGAS